MAQHQVITWNHWLNWAYSELKQASSLSPKLDAEILLGKVVKQSQTHLLAFGETPLKNNQITQLNYLIRRRKKGEPIAYLTGLKEFWSLNFQVAPGAFIPRPDTECLVEKVLNLFPMSNLKVLDLGTGVGTIALSIASERSKWDIFGVDYQKKALILAYKNRSLLKIKNVTFFHGNWYQNLKGKKFNLIVSNPPYINKYNKCWSIKDMRFEPKNALLSKKLGLKDLITICQYSIYHLYPKGWLFLEHGREQGHIVRSLFCKLKFNHIRTILDYNHQERVTYGRR